MPCNVDGKEQALTEMKKGLDKCQRALNEYLDVKKAIYPRFYFVSAVALLDMLMPTARTRGRSCSIWETATDALAQSHLHQG